MPRTSRAHAKDGLFHIIARGVNGQTLFREDDDWLVFMRMLVETKNKFNFSIHVFCLMSNHLHLLLQLGEARMSLFMQELLTRYAVRFNQKYDHWGHVFQGRFKDFRCMTDDYYRNLARYIHLNPVAAGLVSDPGAWRWSSHKELLEGGSLIERTSVLERFGDDASSAKDSYLKFLAQDSRLARLLIARQMFSSQGERAAFNGGLEAQSMELLRELLDAVCVQARLAPSSERLQDDFIARARALGFRLREIGDTLGIAESTVSRKVQLQVRGLTPSFHSCKSGV